MIVPRGIRNNNPGNIIWTGTPLFPGEIGPEHAGTFAVFDTPENGIAAICMNLVAYQDRHNLNTVDGMIRRWSATDQDAYISNVCRIVGVRPHDVVDLHVAPTMQRMVAAIIQQENGVQPYRSGLIAATVNDYLGRQLA